MDPRITAPTMVQPTPNDLPSNSEEPAAAPSLSQHHSEWADDDISTAFPESSHRREDILAPFLPMETRQIAAAQSLIQSPTSAYPPTPASNLTLLAPGSKNQNDKRIPSSYSEYKDDIRFTPTARFKRGMQKEEAVNSPSSVDCDNTLHDLLHSTKELVSSRLAYQENAHPTPSHSHRAQIHLSNLTQSPVMEDTLDLFPEINDLLHSPSEQHFQRSYPRKYEQESLAPLASSKLKPPTRTKRSSSTITGPDQEVFRNSAQLSHNPTNQENFYVSQKDNSRFVGQPHPSNKDYTPRRRRASSLKQTSISTDPEQAEDWDWGMESYEQPLKPSDKIPTYQEFRQTTQRVDTPRSDQFPIPTSAISQYQNVSAELRPPRESDLIFEPKIVQEIYEERWKISQGYEHLQGYFSEPKEGYYKDLSWEEWLEIYKYLKERDNMAMARELVLDLRAFRGWRGE